MTPGATADSATKLAHDICGYLWYLFVICTLGVPVVVHAFATGDLICVIASVITVVSFGLDALFDIKRKGWDLCAMHPDDTNTWYRRLLNHRDGKSYRLVREGYAYTAVPSAYISVDKRQDIINKPLP